MLIAVLINNYSYLSLCRIASCNIYIYHIIQFLIYLFKTRDPNSPPLVHKVLYNMFVTYSEIGIESISAYDIINGVGSFVIVAIGAPLIGSLYKHTRGIFYGMYNMRLKLNEVVYKGYVLRSV